MGDRHYSPMVTHGSHEFDDDLEDGGVLIRRPSLRTRAPRQTEEDRDRDRLRMPPPPRRPSTSVPTRSHMFAPPPHFSTSNNRHSATFDDSDDDESSIFTSPSTAATYEFRPHPVRRPSTVEDKLSHAQRYQAHIQGPTEQLTADSLRKHAPSHDTRSRGTHASGEDMTILVKGTATLTIGEAKMDVREGAEIRIPGGVGGGGSGGSVTTYEERATRYEEEGPQRRRRVRGGSHSRAALPLPSEYGGTQHTYHQQHQHQQQLPYAPYGAAGYAYPHQI